MVWNARVVMPLAMCLLLLPGSEATAETGTTPAAAPVATISLQP